MKYYRVGTIVNTHGLRGEVKVKVITDFPGERFAKDSHLVAFKTPTGTTPLTELTVATSRWQKGMLLVTFAGLADINKIEHLKGATLKVAETDLTDLPSGEYYYHQIIGLQVVTTTGEKLGKIKEVLAPGANDVWVVQRPHASDVLLPKIPDVIKKVDLEHGQVTVELMKGLID